MIGWVLGSDADYATHGGLLNNKQSDTAQWRLREGAGPVQRIQNFRWLANCPGR
ncbi:hypothetical protein CPter291_2901 [Collimonas pratensis]|uniref:Uncharacterized protein n=1 Tax=Collimonas pratensis TaxID=279113 RepID=A0ABM5Z7G0_9BURK|nr:hypothetical protein CPter291_2901 [Collimonas pratensis]